MSKLNQKGFGVVEIIIVVVVIGLIGGLAFVFLNRQGSTEQNKTNDSTSTDTEQPKSKENLVAKSEESKVAAEFPKTLLPDIDYTVVESNTITYGGKTTTMLELKIKGSMEEVKAATETAAKAGGWTIDYATDLDNLIGIGVSNSKNAKEAGAITLEPSASEPGYIEWNSSIGLSGV